MTSKRLGILTLLGLLAVATGCEEEPAPSDGGAPPDSVCRDGGSAFGDAGCACDGGEGCRTRPSDGGSDGSEITDECEGLDCAEHQLCERGGEQDRCLLGECAEGFAWDPMGGRCLPTVGGSCAPLAVDSIADACAALNRECESADGGSARCGGCSPDFAEMEGMCHATECVELGCAAEGRVCELEPEPRCAEACFAGLVWDAVAEACREPLTCGDVSCADGTMCVEGTDGSDASCADLCPAGSGWDPIDQTCRGCGGGVTSPESCQGEGETGRVWVTGANEASTCICETEDGYFVGNSSNSAQPCDIDGDGWITDSARSAIEGDNPYRAQNARCPLRRIDEVRLVNEQGLSHSVSVSVTPDASPVPLPLYESDRNDGAPSAGEVPTYDEVSGNPLPPRAVNALTKACASPIADFNHNGVEDVAEWAGSEVDAPPGARAYVEAYARFSYYVELYDSWYEPGAVPDAPGRLVIRERRRATGDASVPQVPLVYPETASGAYWQQCGRHLDPHYAGPVTSYAGADFYEFGEQWGGAAPHMGGMLHHSQFKCVHVLSVAQYEGTYNHLDHPEKVYLHPDTDRVQWEPGNLGYHLNLCNLQPETLSAPAVGGANPVYPTFECSFLDGESAEVGTARWAVVPYENASATPEGPAPPYERGCINECGELGVEACPTYREDSPAGFVCDHRAPDFGRIQCGCSVDFSGPATSCGLGCGNTGGRVQHFMSPGTTAYERGGVWMCLDAAQSSSGLLGGGSFVLRGHVPHAGTDGQPMTHEGEGYRLTGRVRAEVQVAP